MQLHTLAADPADLAWRIAVVIVFSALVILPAIRILLAAGIYGVAIIRRDDALRRSARRMLPGFAQAVLGLVVGVGTMAAPAAQALSAAPPISLDRVVGAATVTPAPHVTSVDVSRAPDTSTMSLDRIAAASSAPAVIRNAETPTTERNAALTTYTVQRGDSLWSIASEQGGDDESAARWREIWRNNRIVIGDNPSLIRPGMILELGNA